MHLDSYECRDDRSAAIQPVTDRNTAGELRLTDRQRKKFQDFKSAQAHYARLSTNKS